MSKRHVSHTGKDSDGDITALCNPNSTWRRREKADAIGDIVDGVHEYVVRYGGHEALVEVVNGPTGKYLRSRADGTGRNNLDDLPDCG